MKHGTDFCFDRHVGGNIERKGRFMKKRARGFQLRGMFWHVLMLAVLFALVPYTYAQALTINVVDPDGNPVTGYRWTVEEDVTFFVDPNLPPDPEPLAINFHKSYMPLVFSGDSTNVSLLRRLPATKRYFVSVLPYTGYQIAGAPVATGQNSVTIVVNPLPVPTAQISVFVFEDNAPINNAQDLPQERGLPGFKVVLYDAGGRYGISGGQSMLDAFGNPVGTTYNPDGSVAVMGDGNIYTDENGYAIIKNLFPAKYGVICVPPAGQEWMQTTTIEGTPTIDAWVKSNEPQTLVEFGIPSTHVFMGFIQPQIDDAFFTGTSTVSGQVVNFHMGRPPNVADANVGGNFINVRVGLNVIGGPFIYAQLADPATGEFSIPNVPPGLYQLVIWDEYLDIIINFQTVEVPVDGTPVDLGQIAANDWFGHMWFWVFNDANENGFWDDGELPMAEQNINLRFRDGTIYQAFPTDRSGFIPFDEVFPFFNWLIAEVDFARLKATGATIVVDAGGATNPLDPWSFGGILNPQLQPDNADMPFRTETGEVLLE
ncbi:MAG: hypothetical protein C4532_09340, partial [Candidatus Abyssobacteria bacterium SURF_17]